MRYLGTGIEYGTWARLLGDLAEEELAGRALDALCRSADVLERVKSAAQESSFRGEKQRAVRDEGDPRSVGWTFMVRADDPRREAIVKALRPLAEHRRMKDPAAPVLFHGEPASEWGDWLLGTFSRLSPHGRPRYVLMIGDPEQIPFQLQTLLATVASVGRLDFSSIDELESYVGKVLRLERAPLPASGCHAVVFAPDLGPFDPTHHSRCHMATPLLDDVRREGVAVTALLREQATKELLLRSVERCPALVYAASHGVAASGASPEVQKQVQGAIVCAGARGSLFGADDVPMATGDPFFEGSVFFAFACFSAGTPAESDFAHWAGGPARCADKDFVAALPKRLLAHPRGPVAFVGHLDTAFLLGFDDPDSPAARESWGRRMGPFASAVRSLLEVQPCGLALGEMNARHVAVSVHLLRMIEDIKCGRVTRTPSVDHDLAMSFVLRSDARNYLVLGDPAARIRMPDR